MTVLKLKLTDNNLDQLVNYLIQELNFDYENHSTDMSILIADNLYFIHMSAQLNMIIMKKEASFILIDIIGGGGGDGILNMDFGTEKGYTKRTAKVIYKYAEEYSLAVEPV
ncbi:MAG: hypothetical protein ICV53_23420 [Flavisolibacter sp.]|nr:hypothetical protein [Flavisolibacter sp.]